MWRTSRFACSLLPSLTSQTAPSFAASSFSTLESSFSLAPSPVRPFARSHWRVPSLFFTRHSGGGGASRFYSQSSRPTIDGLGHVNGFNELNEVDETTAGQETSDGQEISDAKETAETSDGIDSNEPGEFLDPSSATLPTAGFHRPQKVSEESPAKQVGPRATLDMYHKELNRFIMSGRGRDAQRTLQALQATGIRFELLTYKYAIRMEGLLGRSLGVFSWFRELKAAGLTPDDTVIYAMIKALSHHGDERSLKKVLQLAEEHGIQSTIALERALIELYYHANNLNMAFQSVSRLLQYPHLTANDYGLIMKVYRRFSRFRQAYTLLQTIDKKKQIIPSLSMLLDFQSMVINHIDDIQADELFEMVEFLIGQYERSDDQSSMFFGHLEILLDCLVNLQNPLLSSRLLALFPKRLLTERAYLAFLYAHHPFDHFGSFCDAISEFEMIFKKPLTEAALFHLARLRFPTIDDLDRIYFMFEDAQKFHLENHLTQAPKPPSPIHHQQSQQSQQTFNAVDQDHNQQQQSQPLTASRLSQQQDHTKEGEEEAEEEATGISKRKNQPKYALTITHLNVVIAGAALRRELDRAYATYSEAQSVFGLTANQTTLSLLLSACRFSLNIHAGLRIIEEFEKLSSSDSSLSSSSSSSSSSDSSLSSSSSSSSSSLKDLQPTQSCYEQLCITACRAYQTQKTVEIRHKMAAKGFWPPSISLYAKICYHYAERRQFHLLKQTMDEIAQNGQALPPTLDQKFKELLAQPKSLSQLFKIS